MVWTLQHELGCLDELTELPDLSAREDDPRRLGVLDQRGCQSARNIVPHDLYQQQEKNPATEKTMLGFLLKVKCIKSSFGDVGYWFLWGFVKNEKKWAIYRRYEK